MFDNAFEFAYGECAKVFLCVECGSQVSVVFPDPVCHHGACTPQLDDWQIDWFFGVALCPGAWRPRICTDRWEWSSRFLSRIDRSPDGLVFTLE